MEISFKAGAFDALGQRFASVYDGLESQKLCISEVSSGNSSHFSLPKGTQILSLLWASPAEKSKKRKRASNSIQPQDLVLLGSTTGKLLVFSASKNELLNTLETDRTEILDMISFNGAVYGLTDSSLQKWDLNKSKPVESWSYQSEGLQRLASTGSELVLANTMPHILDWSDLDTVVRTLPGFTTPISQLCLLENGFAASAQEDRQVQVYTGDKNISFMCPSNILYMTAADNYIAVVCEDGQVRVYENGQVKSQIHVRRSNGQTVAVHHAQFSGDFITVAWPEVGASVAAIERIKWKDAEPIAQVTTVRDASTPTVTDHTVNGVDAAAPAAYKEAHTFVSSGNNFKALDEDDSDEGEVTLADRLEALEVNEKQEEEEEEQDNKQTKLKVSAPGSFAVLLNQALSNDDKQLLETCLAEKDEKMIKSSIVRLEPLLATKLLERLAEKISRTQHRSARLLTWIRWVMIVHGGYLVTVPSLLKTLASLYSTLSARTATLPKLLALQGRLDLLGAQMDLRQEILDSKRDVEDEEDVPEFVYNEEEIIANGEEDLGEDADSEDEEDQVEDDDDEEIDDDEMDDDMEADDSDAE